MAGRAFRYGDISVPPGFGLSLSKTGRVSFSPYFRWSCFPSGCAKQGLQSPNPSLHPMQKRGSDLRDSALPWLPDSRDIRQLRKAARDCQGCPLWKNATETVFGTGNSRARWVLVGEQPGDQEDRQGKPFVGPAGRLLFRALADAGTSTEDCYFTNAVKHFKWTLSGKRRIHQKPSNAEILACRPWLLAELASVKPDAVVCLGATAAGALLGSAVRVLRDRGKLFISPLGTPAWITVHPSMLLRMPDRSRAKEEYQRFVEDLRRATNP